MLRTLERETGLKLEFQREVLSGSAGLDTVLFELGDEQRDAYLLAIAYGGSAERVFRQHASKAIWHGLLFDRQALLLTWEERLADELLMEIPDMKTPIVRLDDSNEQPSFSMTRFAELYGPDGCFNLRVSGPEVEVVLPLRIVEGTVHLGTWLSPVSRSGLMQAISYVFGHYRGVQRIEYKNVPYTLPLDEGWRHNDFFLRLPASVEDLRAGMTKKSRYNLRREKRIAEEQFGGLALENVSSVDVTPDVIETFYRFKHATHGVTRQDYDITSLPISDYYLLKTGDGEIRAIALSCEQGADVFIENHTFDSSLCEYSFGKLLYEMYLEALIEKGKTGLALAGGSLDYKSRFGTFCAVTWSGSVSRADWRVWQALQAVGRGDQALAVRRWTGRARLLRTLPNKLLCTKHGKHM